MDNFTKKKALISGITGQDGAYLAIFLLEKGYEVHGIQRRSSLSNTYRLDKLLSENSNKDLNKKLFFHYGDLSDSISIIKIMDEVKPDEVYNLGAQSHVAVSFESPEYTADTVGTGALRILEAIRLCKLEKKTKFYQASTSELYGDVRESPQKESTPFYPRSPYGVAKLYAYWITVNYREAYGIFACNGILFNHESKLRGETFVTRKITLGISRSILGLQENLILGNLDAKRDWGHALDYIEMQWLMLQQEKPNDYCISSGVQYSVREFIETACSVIGINILFEGSGLEEKGFIKSVDEKILFSFVDPKKVNTKNLINKELISVSKEFFRPAEVETLLGDSSKAIQELGWTPKISFELLVKEMIENDLRNSCL